MNPKARLVAGALAILLASCTPADPPPLTTRAAPVPMALPPMRLLPQGRPDTPSRPNAEMVQDFLDLSFLMESGRTIPIMTRFEGPVGVRVAGDVPPSLVPDLRALIERLRTEAGIDIYLTGADTASITIEAVPSAALIKAVPAAACFVVPRLSSWDEYERQSRGPAVDWTTLTVREHAAIFVPSDVAPQEIRDCLHEELAQALGPLDDLYRLPDSVFNDDNVHSVLTGFDMLMLRAYYAPELANGMTRSQAAARLPQILDRLNPAGAGRVGAPPKETPREWIDAVELALTGSASPGRRRAAAADAARLAHDRGWTGTLAGFSLYALGRLEIAHDPDAALEAFRGAAAAFRSSDETRLHEAHVAVQLAAFALNEGDDVSVLRLVDAAVPLATRYQNAALLATLLMFKAEALDLRGEQDAAASVRVDSLGYARYGFGDEDMIRDRLDEIANLAPRRAHS